MPTRLCALGANDTVELEHVRGFFRQYAAWLGVDLSFQGFADEIANLPGAYGAADGRLFYAEVDGKPAGCVGIRRVSEGDAWVHGDRDRLVQVLTNLLSNAVRFSPPQAAITVSVGPAGPGKVRFPVADDGPGVPPEQVEHLFRRFAQVGDPRRRGSGLGLAICKAIVEQHGGTIGLGEGRGGVFQFEIRAARELPSSDLLSDLRAAYRASLPEQIEGLIRLLYQGSGDALQAVHRLHGTAGTYGVHDVRASSAELELALRAGPLEPQVRDRYAAALRAAVSRS